MNQTNKPNKKRILGLVILLVLLAALLAGYFVLDRMDLNSEDAETEEAAKTVLKIDTDVVSGVSYLPAGKDEFALEKKDDAWCWTDDNQMPVNQDTVKAMLSEITLITAATTVQNPGALSEYGLEAPAYTYTVRYTENGKEASKTVLIGDQNSFNGNLYLKLADDDAIYLFSDTITTYFAKDASGWLKTEVLPQLDEKTMKSAVYVTGENEQTVKDASTLSSLCTAYGTLVNTDFYSYAPTDAVLTECGFSDASPKLKLTYTEQVAVASDDEDSSATAATVEKSYTITLTLGKTVKDASGGTVVAYRIQNASDEDLSFVYYMDQTTYDTLVAPFAK